MRKNNKSFRSFSQAEHVSTNVVNLAKQHIAEFTLLGYDATKLESIELLISNVKQFATDKVVVDIISDTVKEKQLTRTNLIQLIAKLQSALKSANIISEGILNIVNLSVTKNETDIKLAEKCGYIKRTLDLNSDKITENGVNETLISNYNQLSVQFLNYMENRTSLKSTRTSAKIDRNAVLDELSDNIAKLMHAGKAIWRYSDTTMYRMFTMAYYSNKNKVPTDDVDDSSGTLQNTTDNKLTLAA